MNRKLMRTASLIAGLVVAGGCLVPAGAGADTAKIGSTLGHASNANGELTTNAVGVQRSQAGGSGSLPLVSPANGVVTQWAVRTSDPGATYNLRILRPINNSSYTSVGQSPTVVVPALTTDSTLNNTVSLPIKQGDAIGVALGPTAGGLPSWPDNVSGDVVGYVPTFSNGAASGNFTDIPGHELNIQATVSFCKVPDVHKQKKVNAKTALTNADCGIKVKKKETHKKKFRGKVLKQKVAPGTTAAPGTVVAIVIGQK